MATFRADDDDLHEDHLKNRRVLISGFFEGKLTLLTKVLMREQSIENSKSVKYHDIAFDAILNLIDYAHEKPRIFP